jgi:hypothetical protein
MASIIAGSDAPSRLLTSAPDLRDTAVDRCDHPSGDRMRGKFEDQGLRRTILSGTDDVYE